MKRTIIVFVVLLTTLAAEAQIAKIMIPAGTPEDKALQAISNEQSAEKRAPMLQEFLQKFADNPQAVAYGNWQLSQYYLNEGDAAQGLAYGEKALAAQPNNMDILMSVASIAQQLKQNDKLVDLAVRGGSAYQGIAKQPKPADLSDADFAQRIADDRNQARPAYEYLETAAYNVIATDDNPRLRMAHIEKFMPAFPGSRFEEQVMQIGVYTLSQMNELTRLAAFADKAVAANPNSASTYVLLANAFAESPNLAHMDKAEAYAHKAIELAKRNGDPAAAKQQELWAGMAHSALGFALLRQEKTVAGIAELKSASEMVKEDTDAYSTVLYRLGFAYAKANKLAEAKAVLTEAAQVKGPAQELSRELLAKVEAAAKRKGTAGR